MAYEAQHLLRKLKSRDPERYAKSVTVDHFQTHPMFDVIEGQIADWEVR